SFLAFFSGFGLLLATIGIFAVVSFVANARRTEMGIRAALGATPGQIRGVVRRHGLGLALTGFLLGLPLALAAGRILTRALPDFAARPGLSVAVATSLLLVAAAAADLPARRAGRADPLKELRSQ